MILETRALRKDFNQGETKLEVLKGADLAVAPGETVAILGKSGSGKSTLLSLLAGLDHPSSGQVWLAGRDLATMREAELGRFRARQLGIVFQQFHLMSHLTAFENIALPLEIARQSDAAQRAQVALDEVGLGARARHFPHQLSGGEKQRVAIARARVIEPPVILADEPSGNLDTATGQTVMDLLFNLVKTKGTALVLVTHNEELAARCGRRLVLREGVLTHG